MNRVVPGMMLRPVGNEFVYLHSTLQEELREQKAGARRTAVRVPVGVFLCVASFQEAPRPYRDIYVVGPVSGYACSDGWKVVS